LRADPESKRNTFVEFHINPDSTERMDDSGATRKPTIRVVNDNDCNLKLVSYLLEFDGYRVVTATTAGQAQAILEHSSPELILMDIRLPGMDGLTLTRKLKSDDRTRHIIIVALTASAMKGDELTALATGCDGYLSKPVDTRKLPR
jgi:two-component system, cell cycle response regulator DivK